MGEINCINRLSIKKHVFLANFKYVMEISGKFWHPVEFFEEVTHQSSSPTLKIEKFVKNLRIMLQVIPNTLGRCIFSQGSGWNHLFWHIGIRGAYFGHFMSTLNDFLKKNQFASDYDVIMGENWKNNFRFVISEKIRFRRGIASHTLNNFIFCAHLVRAFCAICALMTSSKTQKMDSAWKNKFICQFSGWLNNLRSI